MSSGKILVAQGGGPIEMINQWFKSVAPEKRRTLNLDLTHKGIACLLSLLVWSFPVQAQGQGSWGGASGLVGLVLTVVLVLVLFGLLFVGAIFGKRVALVCLGALALAVLYVVIDLEWTSEKRKKAFEAMERAYIEGCAESVRTVQRKAKGSERIFVRVQGSDPMYRYPLELILPKEDAESYGAEVVAEEPSDKTNAILVDMRIERKPVPGSLPDYTDYRSHYEISVRDLETDRVIGRTVNWEARQGFCIRDHRVFLRQVLNRPELMSPDQNDQNRHEVPVEGSWVMRAAYSEVAKGEFLKSTRGYSPQEEVKAELLSRGCEVKNEVLRPESVVCTASTGRSIKVPLDGVLGVTVLHDSWLLVYDAHKGMRSLTSLRVDQRSFDGVLLRTWEANATLPAKVQVGRFDLRELALVGDLLTAVAYGGAKWRSDQRESWSWYTERSTLNVPLPGVN